jgi:hypothetical protein
MTIDRVLWDGADSCPSALVVRKVARQGSAVALGDISREVLAVSGS